MFFNISQRNSLDILSGGIDSKDTLFPIMYIVSEYGVADVYLRTNKDRIRALLKIAHPDYQAELKEQIISTGMISEEEFAE